MPHTKQVVTVIDTFGFFFRSFYALPQHLKTKDGFPTGLLTGFVNFISSLQKEHDSDYIIFAIDSKGDSFRNEIYSEYKAHRSPPPPELLLQLPVAIEWISKMGYKTLGKVGFEADDVIATVVRHAKDRGFLVRVVSHDKDLHQLIDDGQVVLVDAISKKVMDQDECLKKYGVYPWQFCDYQAILGDTADNIPGVKGIGKVGAEKLLKEFGTLDKVYEQIAAIKPAGVAAKLTEFRDDAYMSKQLVTLRDDVFEQVDFDEFMMDVEEPFLNIYDELVQYEQNGILRQIHAKKAAGIGTAPIESKSAISFQATLVSTQEELDAALLGLDEQTVVAFDTETSGLDYEKDHLVGFSFSYSDNEAFYVPIAHFYLGVPEQISVQSAQNAIKKIFNSRVVGHNIKFDLHFVYRFLGVNELDIAADTMVLAWLTNSDMPLSLDKLSKSIFNHEMISFSDCVKKGETFAGVALDDACRYAAEDAFVTRTLYFKMMQKLKDQNAAHLIDEFKSVEMPFLKTLLNMEMRGIKVDAEFLKRFLVEAKSSLQEFTELIYKHAGGEFNINSTQQLGAVLFDKLSLPAGKKTKTGYSTDEAVLNSIAYLHEIVPVILDYREVFKLVSTYIEPLIRLANASSASRIHTSFVQTGTSTGRLSSKEPNLQNIPTRTSLGSKIREAFVAPEGRLLIGLDYSQIELRLLAHFSQNPILVDAFKNNQDIHARTAIALYGEDEAQSKRAVAKTVNFGLLYGMGPKKLSATLGVTTTEAKEIIERYFISFPSIKTYLRSIVDNSKKSGFVETLLGRRRYFNYASASQMLLAAYEREAVNALFQGSAADLIKLSMNKIESVIKSQKLDAIMLLQIHDELIFEVDAIHAESLGRQFQDIMENIYPLTIPLKTSLNIASNWRELKS